jgi:hypothetical protein
MLAKSKWSLILNLIVFSTLAWSADIPYFDGLGFSGSLETPEEVLAYAKAAPGKNKVMAEKGYNFALQAITRINAGASWGGVAKHCTESLLSYPTGKTFLLCVEARLKHGNEVRQRKTKEGEDLSTISQSGRNDLVRGLAWLNSAIALESFEPSLEKPQRKQLVTYRDCLKNYLDTGKTEAVCTPLQWAGF